MNHTPLEDDVRDALHRRVDALQRSPLSVTDVRGRARRIQRRRTIAAGAAVAAVLAIAIPVGLAANSPGSRSEIEPAAPPPAPTVTGTVRIDPRSAPIGAPPAVAMIDVDQPSLFTGDEVRALPKLYDTIFPYMEGWVALAVDEGALSLEFLNQDFRVEDMAVRAGGLVASPDGQRVAWSEYDGARWQVVTAATAGGEEWVYTSFPPSQPESVVEPIGFVSETRVVVSQADSAGVNTTFVVEDGERVATSRFLRTVSSSPATGMIAGLTRTKRSGSCSGVVDADAPTGALAWQTCDYVLGPFSPDGLSIVGFSPETDGYGSPSISLLDAATGEPLVDYELTGARNQTAAINDRVAWEDDNTVVMTLVSGPQQYVVRVDRDGAVERVGGDFASVPVDTVPLVFAARH